MNIETDSYTCATYDFATSKRPGFFRRLKARNRDLGIIRVVRLIANPDPGYDLIGFPREYRASNPECGKLLGQAQCRLVIDGESWKPDEYYRLRND